MSLRDIPVVTVGPGSQPKEDDGSQLEYIALPKEMSRYTMPDTPGTVSPFAARLSAPVITLKGIGSRT